MHSRNASASRSDAETNPLSSPELLPAEHNRLSMPRDWKGNVNNSSGDTAPEEALELDGEWFGDAQEAAGSAVEKVWLLSAVYCLYTCTCTHTAVYCLYTCTCTHTLYRVVRTKLCMHRYHTEQQSSRRHYRVQQLAAVRYRSRARARSCYLDSRITSTRVRMR